MADVKTHIDRPLHGMLCALAAFFLFAVMNALAKMLAETHHVVEIAFYRNLVAVIPMLFWVYAMNNRHILTIHSHPKGIVARAILGTISLVVTFAAYATMPFADTTAFLFASSLIVPVFGFFFLSERVGPYRWGAILIGFVGVIIMCQPTGDVNTIGIALALSAALIHATLQTLVRALGKTESPATVTFYFVFIGMFVSLIPMPFVFTMPTWNELPLIIGVGIAGLVAQLFISRAYKYAQASIVTVFNYSGIIWAMLIGWIVWDEWPTHVILTGAAIVIASNLFILYREQKLAKISLLKPTIKDDEIL